MKKALLLAIPLLLAVCLATSLAFNIYQFLGCDGETSVTKTFTYEWSHGELVVLGQQKITNGTLRLEIAFKREEEALRINATINDNDYGMDVMGLVFDRNGNGFIDIGLADKPYILFSDNYTYYHDVALCKDGRIRCIIQIAPSESTYHNCTFKEDVGYTFDIKIPESELSKVKADILYFYFMDFGGCPSINDVESYWVSVMFEGW